MKLVHDFDGIEDFRGGFASIGNFDGVHRGHQRMLLELVATAHANAAPSIVMTFNPHPITLLRPEQTPPSLSNVQRKAELMAACGVDCLLVYSTTLAFLELTADEFFRTIVLDKLQVRGLIEGPNFYFGKDRGGDVRKLDALCRREGLSLRIAEPVSIEGTMVSSSRVRELIGNGEMEAAIRLLGHLYQISGMVIAGDQRGRELGFPTANLADVDTLVPAPGVYAAQVRLDQDIRPAAVHIGRNSTFAGTEERVEVHVLDFAGDLYGRQLSVQIHKRIRETQRFADADELRRQIQADVAAVRTWNENLENETVDDLGALP